MATDFIKPKSLSNSRIADDTGAYQGICDADIAGWDLGNEFIIVLLAECNAHNGATEEIRIEWQKDGGAWQQLQAGAGELRQGTATALVNCTSPSVNMADGLCGCDAPLQDSHEIEGAISATMSVPNKDIIDMYFAIDPSNGTGGSQYSFRLYSITGAAVIGDGLAWNAQITLVAAVEDDSAELYGHAIITIPDFEELYALFEVQQLASVELYAKVLVQQPSEELYAHAIIRQPSEELYAHAIIRNIDSAELFCKFTVNLAGMQQVIFGGYNIDLDPTATEYDSLVGGIGWGTFEYNHYKVVSTDGVIKHLRVKLSSFPGLGTKYTFTLMLNGAPTALTFDIDGFAIWGSNMVNAIRVTGGDTISIQSDPDGTPTARLATWTCVFEGDTPAESLILGGSDDFLTTGVAEYGKVMNARSSYSATENDFRQVVPTSGVIKNFFVKLNIDPGDDPDGFRFTVRLNGATVAESLIVSIIANATTGSDLVHNLVVVAGDVVTMMIEALNSPLAIVSAQWGMTFLADINGESIVLGGSNSDLHDTNTEYNRLMGVTWSATESFRYSLGQECTLKKLYILLSDSPGAGNKYTFTLRAAGDTAVVAEVAEAAIIGNSGALTDTVANDEYMSLKVVPTDTPTVRDAYWGFVCYIAPPLEDGFAELYAHAIIRQPASVDLYAHVEIQQALTDSAELYTHFIIRQLTSADLYGLAEIQQPSEELYAHAIIRQPASMELYAFFEVQVALLPASVELYAQAEIQQSASVEAYAHAIIRNIGTADLYAHTIITPSVFAELYGTAEIRQETSADLYAHVEIQDTAELYAHAVIRNIGSAEVYAHFIVRNIGSTELYGTAEIRQPASAELYAHVEIQDTAELYAHAIIQQPVSVELYAHAIIRQSTTEEIYAHGIVRQSTSLEVYGHAEIRQPATEEIYAHAIISPSTSVELYAHAIIRQTTSLNLYAHVVIQDTAELYGHAIIRNIGTAELYALFEIQQALTDSAELYTHFIIRQLTSADLYGLAEIQQPSEELYAHAIIRQPVSLNLYAHAVIRNIGSAEVYAHAIIRNIGSVEAYGHAEIRQLTSVDLYAHAIIRQPASAELYGTAEIQQTASVEVYGHGIIRQPASAEIYGHAEIQQPSSAEAYAHAIIRQPTSTELYAHAIIRSPVSFALYAHAIIRHPDSAELYAHVEIQDTAELYAYFIVRHPASTELYGNAVIKQSASVELYARFEIQRSTSTEVYAHLIIRNIGTAEIYGLATIQNIASTELYASFVIQTGLPGSAELYGHVIIRPPVSIALYAHAIIRHPDSADLYAHAEIQDIEDLYAHAIIRQPASAELLARFEVGQGSAELYASANIRNLDSQELFSAFIVRQLVASNLYFSFYVRPFELRAGEMIIGGRDRLLDIGGTDREMIIGGRDRLLDIGGTDREMTIRGRNRRMTIK